MTEKFLLRELKVMMERRHDEDVIRGLSDLHIVVLGETVDVAWEEAFADGWYEVEIDDDQVIGFSIEPDDSVTLAAVDRLFREVLRLNRDAVDRIADPDDPEQLMAVGRQAFEPVRLESYQEGEYEVEVEGEDDEILLTYNVTERQVDLLRRYHQLLFRVYREGDNRQIIDGLVEERSDLDTDR